MQEILKARDQSRLPVTPRSEMEIADEQIVMQILHGGASPHRGYAMEIAPGMLLAARVKRQWAGSDDLLSRPTAFYLLEVHEQ